MTIEEVKRGLRGCAEDNCGECPYRKTKFGCIVLLMRDAVKVLEQLEKEKEETKEKEA